jgi:arginase family enzyme
MTVVEVNPDHDPDGTSVRRLVAALAAALVAMISAAD